MNKIDYAPVVIPTLNRYKHFRRCVESFACCSLADKTELVIGLDYPPSDKYRSGYEQIKEYLPSIQGFKKVTILRSDYNLGVTENCNRMYRYVKEQGYESYIFSEDDNEVSPCFLEFANWGLQYTKDDDSIYAVCGFKRVDTSCLKNNVYIYPRYNAWGFAQWFKRRDKLNKFRNLAYLKNLLDQMSIFDVFSSKLYLGESIIGMLKEKSIHGDCLPQFLPKEEQYCLFPTDPMSKNHGQDGSGIHGGTSKTFNLYENLLLSQKRHFDPHIEEALYQPRMKEIYSSTYRVPISYKVRAIIDFLLYKTTKLGVYHQYGQPQYRINLKKVDL